MTPSINLEKEYRRLSAKLIELDKKEQKIIKEKHAILAKMNTFREVAKLTRTELPLGIPATPTELELFFSLNENTRLGDAIETLLVFKGPLSRKEIIAILREYRVPISTKAPEQVLANAIMRDKENRFMVLDDRRIALRAGKK